jgi:heptosyltransferase-1
MISDRRRERVNWHSMAALARELRARQFDLVIDLMGNRYSAAFTFLLRPRLGIGFDGQELGWLYSLRVQAELPGDHLSRRPLRVIQPLIQRAGSVSDGTNQRVLPSPPFPTVDPRELLAELGLSDKRYQVVAPFAGWSAKEWPSNNFARLAAALKDRGFAVVIVGTVAQQARCTELASAMASPQAGGIAEDPTVPRVIVFAGRPLGELVALLSHAGGAAANDSAVAHIAAAFGLPTAAIFTANTNPQNAAPLGPKARVFPQDCSIDEVTAHLTGE